jgi:SPX domain protein involved in polyphosphate accumulation
MTQLSHIIRKFNRFELKYVVTLHQAELIKTALKAYLQPDEHGSQDGRYRLTSLYYDSPDYRCYWEKVDGIKFRRKLRIRCYETDTALTDETTVFVEIKQRMDRVTQKRRIILTYREALRLCNQREMPDHAADDDVVINEIDAFLWQYNLRPASLVRYDRQAFIGSDYDLGLRVTFDTNLTYQVNSLNMLEPMNGLSMLPTGFEVMEVKVNERIPYWLTELVAAHNLQLVRMSKYCRSIEAANIFSSKLPVSLLQILTP